MFLRCLFTEIEVLKAGTSFRCILFFFFFPRKQRPKQARPAKAMLMLPFRQSRDSACCSICSSAEISTPILREYRGQNNQVYPSIPSRNFSMSCSHHREANRTKAPINSLEDWGTGKEHIYLKTVYHQPTHHLSEEFQYPSVPCKRLLAQAGTCAAWFLGRKIKICGLRGHRTCVSWHPTWHG